MSLAGYCPLQARQQLPRVPPSGDPTSTHFNPASPTWPPRDCSRPGQAHWSAPLMLAPKPRRSVASYLHQSACTLHPYRHVLATQHDLGAVASLPTRVCPGPVLQHQFTSTYALQPHGSFTRGLPWVWHTTMPGCRPAGGAGGRFPAPAQRAVTTRGCARCELACAYTVKTCIDLASPALHVRSRQPCACCGAPPRQQGTGQHQRQVCH